MSNTLLRLSLTFTIDDDKPEEKAKAIAQTFAACVVENNLPILRIGDMMVIEADIMKEKGIDKPPRGDC